MARQKLVHQFRYVDPSDLATLNVGAGTIDITGDGDGKIERFRLLPIYVQMIKEAYERGLARKPLY